MAARPLHIAWLGPAPGSDSGVPGVASNLVTGLTALGHRIDCFLPSAGHTLPEHIANNERIAICWGSSTWRWDRWYSRTRITAFLSGMILRGLAMVRLRRQIARRHRRDPYDVLYQFSTIESLAVPPRLARSVPLVIHPETHGAGELRALIDERALARRTQPAARFALVVATMLVRTLVQRRRIGRARLLVCISRVFRDHLVADYGVPAADTVVVPNPVRLERFAGVARPEPPDGRRPEVLVLGRIAARKGIEDVVALAGALRDAGSAVRLRVVGGPSLWTDYTPLLEDLPSENAEYAGGVAGEDVAGELARCDLLLQASHYEPFALTVAEALAAGAPVVGTTEVGAIQDVDRAVCAEVGVGDIAGMAAAIDELLRRAHDDPVGTSSLARSEAARLFAPAVVAGQISDALCALVDQGA